MSAGSRHHPYDRATRDAWRRATVEFTEALFRHPLPADAVAEQTNFEQGPLNPDAVVTDANGVKVHVEIQSTHDPTIGLRMARYCLALVQHHHGPAPEQHLVLLRKDADRAGLGSYTLGRLSITYQVTRLWQVDPERLLSHVGLAGLASIAKADTEDQRIQLLIRAGRMIRAEMPPDQAASALAAAADLATIYLDPRVVEKALRRNDMPVDLSITKNAIQAREQGLQEGHKEGRQEGQRDLVRGALQRRFGDPALTERVSEIPNDQLLDAIDRALTGDADDFTAWLDELPR